LLENHNLCHVGSFLWLVQRRPRSYLTVSSAYSLLFTSRICSLANQRLARWLVGPPSHIPGVRWLTRSSVSHALVHSGVHFWWLFFTGSHLVDLSSWVPHSCGPIFFRSSTSGGSSSRVPHLVGLSSWAHTLVDLSSGVPHLVVLQRFTSGGPVFMGKVDTSSTAPHTIQGLSVDTSSTTPSHYPGSVG
jgi:hypothetical protein